MRISWKATPALLAVVACSEPEPAPPPPPSGLSLDARGRVPTLVCPGDPQCPSASGALFVGVAARAITPTIEPWTETTGDMMRQESETFEDTNGNGVWDPVWLAGFGVGRAATGIHDDTWARAVTFRQGDVHVGVVTLDTVGFFHDSALAVRAEALARGLDLDHVAVASTHVHETQDTMGLWGVVPLVRSIDEAYLARVVRTSVDALEAAITAEKAASVEVAQGDASPLVDDSRLPQLLDATFTVFRFTDDAAHVFATWTIWGNHPETLDGDNQLSTSDYPHYTRARMESEYPGSTAVFSSGSLGGLMTPLHIVGCPDANGVATCRPGQWEMADYVGTGLGDRAVAALANPRKVEAPALSVRRGALLLGASNEGFATTFALNVVDRRLFHPDGNPFTANETRDVTQVDILDGRALIETEVNLIGLGGAEILFVPGELYPELWLAGPEGQSFAEKPEGRDFPDAPIDPPLTTLLKQDAMRAIVNQANDSLGYVIPKSQFDWVAPFAYGRDSPQYGEVNSIGPETAPMITGAVRDLLAK